MLDDLSAAEVARWALGALGAFASAVVEHPALLAPIGAAILLIVFMGSPAGRSRPSDRDPRRGFTADERRHSFEIAGHRCEHKHPLWTRCTNTPSQADHVFPWSKGGWTRPSNLQALCAFHNNRKSGSVPTRMYVWRLVRRRRRYFPPDEDPHIEWRAGAAR